MDLLIDQQTIRDLELFETPNGGQTLFAMLDRARTRGGSVALNRRFARPFSDAPSIRSVQESVRYAIDHPDVFSWVPSQFVISGFEHYLHWHVTAPIAGMGLARISEMVQLRIDNSREYQQISMGVANTVIIVRALQQLIANSVDTVIPGIIGGLMSEVAELLDRPALRNLPKPGVEDWPFWTILNVDREFRTGERATLIRLVHLLFEIDAIGSMATATTERGFVLPELIEGPAQVCATGVFHPAVQAPVVNPLHVDQRGRFLFLTGPNMAGKTTYLRSCATAIYLAHVGMSVPAESFRFAPCDAFFTAISLSDDIHEGISFFQAEARRARAIAEALANGLRVCAIMDEPFKGTNVKDALDASCAFFTRLANREGSIFLIASHLIEASPALMETGCVECFHFEAREDGEMLRFDYTLRPGVSDQRLGMRVLKEHDVFTMLDG